MIDNSHYVLIYMWYQSTWLIEFMIMQLWFFPILINPKFKLRIFLNEWVLTDLNLIICFFSFIYVPYVKHV